MAFGYFRFRGVSSAIDGLYIVVALSDTAGHPVIRLQLAENETIVDASEAAAQIIDSNALITVVPRQWGGGLDAVFEGRITNVTAKNEGAFVRRFRDVDTLVSGWLKTVYRGAVSPSQLHRYICEFEFSLNNFGTTESDRLARFWKLFRRAVHPSEIRQPHISGSVV